MTDPSTNLQAAMLSRASDLAHYLSAQGLTVEVVTGHTLSGLPCTMILAVDAEADRIFQLGERLVEEAAARREAERDQAEKN